MRTPQRHSGPTIPSAPSSICPKHNSSASGSDRESRRYQGGLSEGVYTIRKGKGGCGAAIQRSPSTRMCRVVGWGAGMPLIWWVFRRPLLAGRSNSTVQSLPSGSVGSCRSRAEEVVEVVWWLWCWLLATHCVLATGWAAIEHTTTGRPWCYRLRTKSNYRLVVLLAMQHAGPGPSGHNHNLSIAHHAADESQLMRMRGIMCDVRVCASCRHRLAAVACSGSPHPSGLLASSPTCNLQLQLQWVGPVPAPPTPT
jgi:hypothetical protein